MALALRYLSEVNYASSEQGLLAAQPGQLAPGSLCHLAGQQLEGRAAAPLCLGDGSPGHEDKGIQISGRVRVTLALAGAPLGISAQEEACIHGVSESSPQRSTRACTTPGGGRSRAPCSQEAQVNCQSKARNMGTRRKCTLAVRRDICWAPCRIINNWNQVEERDGWGPLGNLRQADLTSLWEEIDGIARDQREIKQVHAGGDVHCSKPSTVSKMNEKGWASSLLKGCVSFLHPHLRP